MPQNTWKLRNSQPNPDLSRPDQLVLERIDGTGDQIPVVPNMDSWPSFDGTYWLIKETPDGWHCFNRFGEHHLGHSAYHIRNGPQPEYGRKHTDGWPPEPVDLLVEAMREVCRKQGMATKYTPIELTKHLRDELISRGLVLTLKELDQ